MSQIKTRERINTYNLQTVKNFYILNNTSTTIKDEYELKQVIGDENESIIDTINYCIKLKLPINWNRLMEKLLYQGKYYCIKYIWSKDIIVTPTIRQLTAALIGNDLPSINSYITRYEKECDVMLNTYETKVIKIFQIINGAKKPKIIKTLRKVALDLLLLIIKRCDNNSISLNIIMKILMKHLTGKEIMTSCLIALSKHNTSIFSYLVIEGNKMGKQVKIMPDHVLYAAYYGNISELEYICKCLNGSCLIWDAYALNAINHEKMYINIIERLKDDPIIKILEKYDNRFWAKGFVNLNITVNMSIMTALLKSNHLSKNRQIFIDHIHTIFKYLSAQAKINKSLRIELVKALNNIDKNKEEIIKIKSRDISCLNIIKMTYWACFNHGMINAKDYCIQLLYNECIKNKFIDG